MYKSFTARNFRCFEDLTVEPLERFNLIAGKNNTGKTALLEALWQHHGYFNPQLGHSMAAFRGFRVIKKSEFMWDLFVGFDAARVIELSTRDEQQRPRTLRIQWRERAISTVSLAEPADGRDTGFTASDSIAEQSSKPAESEILLAYTGVSGEATQARASVRGNALQFESASHAKEPGGIFLPPHLRRDIPALAERLSNVAVAKRKAQILDIVSIIEPDLEDLAVLHQGGVPMIAADIGMERLIPLPFAGDGMIHLLSIAVAVPEAKDGILLVDEIENGLHYTVLTRVWRAIAALAREYNVQFFATTHSFECIAAAHRAFEEDGQYDFRLHRLERVEGKIRSVTYDQETLTAGLEMGMEVR